MIRSCKKRYRRLLFMINISTHNSWELRYSSRLASQVILRFRFILLKPKRGPEGHLSINKVPDIVREMSTNHNLLVAKVLSPATQPAAQNTTNKHNTRHRGSSEWLTDEWKLHLFSSVRKWYDRTLLRDLNKCSIPIFQSGQHCNIEVYHYVMTTSSMDRQVELNVPSLFVIGDTVAWLSLLDYIEASLCNT